MKSKVNLKHVTASFLCGSMLFSGVALAQTEPITVAFQKLKFMVQGEDRSAVVPESIVYKGTTYVPIRKVGEMLNMPVQWEEATKTVWMGEVELSIKDASGAEIGQVQLSQTVGGVSVHVEASGLTPGKHGFHLHEKAIEGNDFKTAGGHFNPHSKQHGHDNPAGHHAGDLQNLEVNEDGTVKAHFVLEGVTLEKGNELSVWGKSFIIHAKEDDFKTDPAGNAGDRIAGATIQ